MQCGGSSNVSGRDEYEQQAIAGTKTDWLALSQYLLRHLFTPCLLLSESLAAAGKCLVV